MKCELDGGSRLPKIPRLQPGEDVNRDLFAPPGFMLGGALFAFQAAIGGVGSLIAFLASSVASRCS